MAKKATYIQAKVSGGSTVESFEIVDKGARGDVSSLSSRVSTLENAPAPQDGKSISVKSATKSNGVTTVVLTDGTTDTTLTINDGTDGQDGTSVTVTEVANGVEVSDGTNSVTITNGKDGSDGKSVYESYLDTTSDSPALSETDWVASLHGQNGTSGSDGTSPTISANSSNTVTYNQSTQQYEVASGATDYIYKLDVSYGSGDQRNFTTPNLMDGASAVLNAVAEIMSQTASVSQQSNGNNE